MTPKEKTIDLIEQFRYHLWIDTVSDYERAKQCALIAVQELLSETEERDGMRVINNPYWLEVRNEIEKL
jgi:hypothetical protein